jgi:hypothetical protein
MEMSEDQILDLWDLFTNYIDSNKKEEASLRFINWCVDHGVPDDVLQAVGDQDPYLAEAVDEIVESEDIHDDYSDDNYGNEDDEDRY